MTRALSIRPESLTFAAMRFAAVALVLAAVGGCDNIDGRSCITSADCGGSRDYVCRYPWPSEGGPLCPSHGTCLYWWTHCPPPDVYQPVLNRARPADPDAPTRHVCGCSGRMEDVNVFCPDVPVLSPSPFDCICGAGGGDPARSAYSFAPVHAGPRAPDEYCAYGPGEGGQPAVCCDCSLARVGASLCETDDFRLLPFACCDCFTETAPDATGRCGPPGGIFSGGFPWCCPIASDPDAGVAPPDGG